MGAPSFWTAAIHRRFGSIWSASIHRRFFSRQDFVLTVSFGDYGKCKASDGF